MTDFQSFVDAVHKILTQDGLPIDGMASAIDKAVADIPGDDTEMRKLVVDQALRVIWGSTYTSRDPQKFDKLASFLNIAFYMTGLCDSSETGCVSRCHTTMPGTLVAEMFECSLLGTNCEQAFGIVENALDHWTRPQLFEICKNQLLRACNELLRRTCKSHHSAFAGRVQLFLSRLFPLEEKSALNLMGHFNTENVTLYRTTKWEGNLTREEDEMMEDDLNGEDVNDDLQAEEVASKKSTEDGEMEVDESLSMTTNRGKIPIDFTIYKRFWSLQDFFRQPSNLFESSDNFKVFKTATTSLLKIFQSFKLEDSSGTVENAGDESSHDQDALFSKYLTAENLLDLQLNDSVFRRCILLQLLITLQYVARNRSSSGGRLTLDQELYAQDMTENVLDRLAETPPAGPAFVRAVKEILKREASWTKWKDDGCPSFARPPLSDTFPRTTVTKPRRPLGQALVGFGKRKITRMGNPALNRMWDRCHDNMEACLQAPDEQSSSAAWMRNFFHDPIMELDPAARMDDEYKCVNTPQWQWRALRVMAMSWSDFYLPLVKGPSAKTTNLTVAQFLEKNLLVMKDKFGLVFEEPPPPSETTDGPQIKKENASVNGGDENSVDDSMETTPNLNGSKSTPSSGTKRSAPVTSSANGDVTPKEEKKRAKVLPNQDSYAPAKDHITALAKLIGPHWPQVAVASGLFDTEDDVAYFKMLSPDTDPAGQAKQMLMVWADRATEDRQFDLDTISKASVKAGLNASLADKIKAL